MNFALGSGLALGAGDSVITKRAIRHNPGFKVMCNFAVPSFATSAVGIESSSCNASFVFDTSGAAAVTVNALGQRCVYQLVIASIDNAFLPEQICVTFGGVTVNIDVAQGISLQDLAQLIQESCTGQSWIVCSDGIAAINFTSFEFQSCDAAQFAFNSNSINAQWQCAEAGQAATSIAAIAKPQWTKRLQEYSTAHQICIDGSAVHFNIQDAIEGAFVTVQTVCLSQFFGYGIRFKATSQAEGLQLARAALSTEGTTDWDAFPRTPIYTKHANVTIPGTGFTSVLSVKNQSEHDLTLTSHHKDTMRPGALPATLDNFTTRFRLSPRV